MPAWRRRPLISAAPTSPTPTNRTAIHPKGTGTPNGREEAAGNAETVTVVLTFWAPETAKSVTVPEQLAPKVAVVVTLPLASVVPDAGLNVTTHPAPPPAAENVTPWPAPPAKWTLQVTVPPAVCVVGTQEALVPGVPL